jgi:CheY-like chemotaxis protein
MMEAKGANILIIEDDDVDAMSIERSFRACQSGSTITRARDGVEALDLLDARSVEPPYIIVADIQMPRMTGVEFIEKVRSSERHKDSVIFVLTTSKAGRDVNACYQNHVAGYFSKDEAGRNFKDVVNIINDYTKLAVLPGSVA